MKQSIGQKQVEEHLRQEFEADIKERVKWYLQIKPHGIIAATHFAAVSAKCSFLFRDGHYYGCVALTQAVAEALVRFKCEKNLFRPGKDFEKNVERLASRGFISDDIKNFL
jgi:dihydroneopterin aldolase